MPSRTYENEDHPLTPISTGDKGDFDDPNNPLFDFPDDPEDSDWENEFELDDESQRDTPTISTPGD